MFGAFTWCHVYQNITVVFGYMPTYISVRVQTTVMARENVCTYVMSVIMQYKTKSKTKAKRQMRDLIIRLITECNLYRICMTRA